MRTSDNKINPTVKEGGRGYNNDNNNNNKKKKKKKKVFFTDGLCHIMWFSIGYCIKTNFSHFTPQVGLFFVEKKKPKLFELKSVM